MFTGIVQAMGQVEAIARNPFGVRLVIDASRWRPQAEGYWPRGGDSICISGVCLTVVELRDKLLPFDVIAETLAKTTLGDLKVGDAVNIEPAVTASQPLGGHFMQGHVDGVGVMTQVYAGKDEWRITIEPPGELVKYIVPKGSIAIDGVSLTIAAAGRGRSDFEVALIPTTLELTTLGRAKEGGRVNLEADIISKTVVHHLERMREDQSGGGVTAALLKEAGFAEG